MFILQFYIPTLDEILEELKGHVLEHKKAKEGATKEQESTTSKLKRKSVTVGTAPAAFPLAPAAMSVFSIADLSLNIILDYYLIL